MSASRAVGVTTAILVAIVVSLALGGTAQAYPCSQIMGFAQNAGVAKTDGLIYWRCADGRVHVKGFAYDTACDARSGWAEISFYLTTSGPAGPWSTLKWEAGAGCGSSRLYDLSETADRYPFGMIRRVRICTYASNGLLDSSTKACGFYLVPPS
jgi:hypothetical protein